MELGNERRRNPDRDRYLDDAYWAGLMATSQYVPEDVSGLMVLQDLRDDLRE